MTFYSQPEYTFFSLRSWSVNTTHVRRTLLWYKWKEKYKKEGNDEEKKLSYAAFLWSGKSEKVLFIFYRN